MMLKTVSVLDVKLSLLKSHDHTVDYISNRIKEQKKTFCIAINPIKIYTAQTDGELKSLLNSADIHICDGVGAAIAAQILYGKKVGRVTGVQLFLTLMARAEQEGLKVFLLGAKPEANEGAYQKLKEKHPDLQIVGRQDGYFENDMDVVEKINASNADMLFVAMGSPRQEKWLNKHRHQINAPYCMGVGGAFDAVSGIVKRAPKIFCKTGTEFLYRLICQPKRLKSQLVLPKFVYILLKAKMFSAGKYQKPVLPIKKKSNPLSSAHPQKHI